MCQGHLSYRYSYVYIYIYMYMSTSTLLKMFGKKRYTCFPSVDELTMTESKRSLRTNTSVECTYACMHVFIHLFIYLFIYLSIYLFMYVCMYVRTGITGQISPGEVSFWLRFSSSTIFPVQLSNISSPQGLSRLAPGLVPNYVWHLKWPKVVVWGSRRLGGSTTTPVVKDMEHLRSTDFCNVLSTEKRVSWKWI